MTDRTLVVYSSLTGNTKAVAEKIFDIIEGDKEIVSINDIKNVDTAPITIGLNISSGGLIVSFIPPVTI